MELIYCTELPQYLEQDPKRVMTLDMEKLNLTSETAEEYWNLYQQKKNNA